MIRLICKVDRREFINKAGIGSVALASLPMLSFEEVSSILTQDTPEPSVAQKTWMQLGFGMFIHFGINTYYDKEWSDGTLDISVFNPTKLNTDQWMAAAKAAGMKYVVIITKHHDGFCLWPTAKTKYSVANTAFGRDFLYEVVSSAQKYDLKIGFYYSLWDRHEKSHDTNIRKYVNEFMVPQLEELLTQYGDIIELWFDGFWKYQKNGWAKKNEEIDGEAKLQEKNAQRDLDFIEAWRAEGAYHWQMDYVYQMIKSIQPNCLVMNNSTTAYPGVPLHPIDIRSGEKYTQVAQDQKVWNWLGKDQYFPLQIETTLSVKGNDRFQSGNWFWHEWDHSVLTKDEIKNYLSIAGKMEANLLLNAGPSPDGLLRPEDEKVLKSLGA